MVKLELQSEGAVALFHDDGISLRFEGVYII